MVLQNALAERVRMPIPPGFRGLRTPLITGGSIAWKSTARRGLLVAEVASCDETLLLHERRLVESRRLFTGLRIDEANEEVIEQGLRRAKCCTMQLIT